MAVAWAGGLVTGPTARQLQVLETYARLGSYKLAAVRLGIGVQTVRTTLARVRCTYGTESTIQAYRLAVAAGDIRPTSRVLVASG